MNNEQRELKPYDSKAIIKSIEDVIDKHDICCLSKEAYKYCTLYLGFTAHYNHHVFMQTYVNDLVTFVVTISNADVKRYDKNKWFTEQYGKPYVESIYKVGQVIIPFAKARLNHIKSKQFQLERTDAKRKITELKKKFNL